MAVSGEDASNIAVVVHLATVGIAALLVAVAVWRRLRNPRRPALRYVLSAAGLVAISAVALLYAAWP